MDIKPRLLRTTTAGMTTTTTRTKTISTFVPSTAGPRTTNKARIRGTGRAKAAVPTAIKAVPTAFQTTGTTTSSAGRGRNQPRSPTSQTTTALVDILIAGTTTAAATIKTGTIMPISIGTNPIGTPRPTGTSRTGTKELIGTTNRTGTNLNGTASPIGTTVVIGTNLNGTTSLLGIGTTSPFGTGTIHHRLRPRNPRQAFPH